jgi:hypothetical protein
MQAAEGKLFKPRSLHQDLCPDPNPDFHRAGLGYHGAYGYPFFWGG